MKKRSYKKRAYKKKSAPKKKTSLKKNSVKRMIRTEIARNTEDKTTQTLLLESKPYSSSNVNFNTGNIIQVSPGAVAVQIGQGTGQGQRIGNKIKLKKLMMKGTFVPQPVNAENPALIPVQVKLLFMYNKQTPATAPAPSTDLFQFGGGTYGLSNKLVDLWAPVNTDKYRVCTSRTFKLGHAGTTGFGNNDFKYNVNFKVNVAKYLPKVTRFNDNNTDPITRGLWMAVIMCNADGSQIPANTRPVIFTYMLDATYEDA